MVTPAISALTSSDSNQSSRTSWKLRRKTVANSSSDLGSRTFERRSAMTGGASNMLTFSTPAQSSRNSKNG
jgi:hypothetical protein